MWICCVSSYAQLGAISPLGHVVCQIGTERQEGREGEIEREGEGETNRDRRDVNGRPVAPELLTLPPQGINHLQSAHTHAQQHTHTHLHTHTLGVRVKLILSARILSISCPNVVDCVSHWIGQNNSHSWTLANVPQ